MKTLFESIIMASVLMASSSSCGDRADALETVECGCGGPVTQTLNDELGLVEYTGNDKDILRIFIRSGEQYTHALVLCNEEKLPKEYKKNGLKIKVSGQQGKICPDASRNAGYPFTLTSVGLDSSATKQ